MGRCTATRLNRSASHAALRHHKCRTGSRRHGNVRHQSPATKTALPVCMGHAHSGADSMHGVGASQRSAASADAVETRQRRQTARTGPGSSAGAWLLPAAGDCRHLMFRCKRPYHATFMSRTFRVQASRSGRVQRSAGTGTGITYEHEEDGQRRQVSGTLCAFLLKPRCRSSAEAERHRSTKRTPR